MNIADNVALHTHSDEPPPLASPLYERVYEANGIIVTRIRDARFGHQVRIDIKP